jgi:hypothetical protein
MRRDYLIAILLAVGALASGPTLMVAPEYLHIPEPIIPIVFWGGLGLTIVLTLAAIAIALRGEVASLQETSVTPNQIGYNVALAAIIASIVAAFKHAPKAAWAACIVALFGLGVDYWTGPPRGLLLSPSAWWRSINEPISLMPYIQPTFPLSSDSHFFCWK